MALVLALAVACLATSALADTIVRSFKAQGTISPGWAVAITKADQEAVELAPASDATRLYGVAIDPSDAPVTVQKENQQVFVATTGDYPVIVSTQYGAIKSGDYLTISSTDGITAKASNKDSYVLGRALGDYDGSQGTILRSGGSAVGKINAQINPGKNPLSKTDPSVPGPLQRLAESVAGKPLSAARIYVSLTIFLITLLVAASLIIVGIRAGMTAIGRNPLSKHSILQSLAQVIVAAALVLIGGIFGIFLLLKL